MSVNQTRNPVLCLCSEEWEYQTTKMSWPRTNTNENVWHMFCNLGFHRVPRSAWPLIIFSAANLRKSHAKASIHLIVSNWIIEDERISMYAARLIVAVPHRRCLLAIWSTHGKKHKLKSMSWDPEAHPLFSGGKKQLTLRLYENSISIEMDLIIAEANLWKASNATTHTQATDYLQTPYDSIPIILKIYPYLIVR